MSRTARREEPAPARPSGPTTPATDALCSIERTAAIIGDRWTLLILREIVIRSVTRFSELTHSLGIAANILTNRLELLTTAGIIERREYQVEGARARMGYHPTAAGQELLLILAALGQWGDEYVPPPGGVVQNRELAGSGQPVRVGFVTDPATLAPAEQVTFVYTDAADPAYVASDPRRRPSA